MQLNEIVSALEAVLFACGEPVDSSILAESLAVGQEDIKRLAASLNARYSDCGSSLRVIRLDDSYQLIAVEEWSDYIRSTFDRMDKKRNQGLSPAAVEVLTVIAYNQPVTRSFIDDVRGVDSGRVVNTLLEKELIEEAGRLDIPGRPVLFRTTKSFLRCFGLSSLEALPLVPEDGEQLSLD